MDHLIIIQAIFPFYKKIKKILKKFLKLLTFCPFQSAISEGVIFLKNIQLITIQKFSLSPYLENFIACPD